MTTSKYQRQTRATGGKAPGGSRINLRFGGPVTCEELTDIGRLIAHLDPLVDASSLRIEAAKQAIAPEWAEAAAQKRVVEGMDKGTVFAIMGEPKEKHVDLAADPPVEKWLYELGDMKSRVISFRDGKVIRIDEL